MWGFSPAMNLYETPQLYNQFPCILNIVYYIGIVEDEDEAYNILLVQPGDIRHVLKTISERRRLHGNQAIHFYIYDKPIEVITKDLLMLQIATDWCIPIRTRINTWLEVYGNILLQERTESYVYEQSKAIINLLCNNQGFLNDIVDFSCLKYKEKDEIEEVLKSYDTRVPCDIERLYDDRLRHSYRDRYDNRTNLIDWDYNMNGVHDTAGIIHKKLYKTWRTTGIGFEFGDQVYNKPNRTMISYCEGRERGNPLLRRGLWTDITISPYHTFGIDCYKSNNYAKDLFLVLNKGTGAEQWRHNCCEVSVYNLLCYFTEIETGRIYKMRKEHDIFSGLNDDEKNEEPKDMREDKSSTTETTTTAPQPPSTEKKDIPELPKEKLNTIKEENEEEEELSEEKEKEKEEDLLKEKEKRAEMTALEIIQSFDNIKIFFVTGDFNNAFKKKKFKNLFHRVVFSNVGVHLLDSPEFVNMLKPDCCVTLESVRHMTILKPEQKIEYLKRVHGMAEKCGLKCCVDLSNKEKLKEMILELENVSYIRESKKDEDKKEECEKKEDDKKEVEK